MKSLIVFLSVFALDFAWTYYTQALAERRELPAALWASLIIAISGFAISEYAHDKTLLLPAAAGAFLGTIAAMRWDRHKHRKP